MFSSLISATLLLSGLVSALPRPAHDMAEYSSELSYEAAAKTEDSAKAYATGSYESSEYGSSSYEESYEDDSSYEESYDDSYDTSAVEESWTTTEESWTTSTSAYEAYSTPSYGSGSDNWSEGYDDCVQQCLATFGSLDSATYAPTATSGEYEGSSGTGATHTVIVAPSQGVLRYVPFALNASVGDTIMFMWGANNHTVTKSDALTPCNKTGDALFASGTQNAGFVFTQVVNTTDPTFFYCATVGHCPKGMFGVVNPPNSLQGTTSVGSMMQSVAANNSDVKAYAAYTTTQTAGSKAANWGTNIDIGSMPEWSYAAVMENVLFTRNLLAANPDIMAEDGSIDLSAMATTPLMVPDDVSAALSNAAAVDSDSTSSTEATSSTDSAAAETTSSVTGASSTDNGAGSVAASKVFVGAAALVATFFLL